MKKYLVLSSLLLGIASMGSAQTPQWIWAQGGDSVNTSATAESVASDAEGHSAICGVYYSNISISGNYLQSPPGYIANFYAAFYDKDGSLIWAHRIGSVLQSQGNIIKTCIDSNRNLYVFGYYQDSAEFGDTAMYTPNYTSVFTAKYDALGNRIWIRTLATNVEPFDNNHQSAYKFASSVSSNLYIAGAFHYSADFGNTVLQAANAGMYFASFNADGTLKKAIILPDSGNCSSLYVASEPSGGEFIYVCGELLPSGNLFVDKLSPDGTQQWQVKGSPGYSLAEGIAASEHSVYLTGSFSDTVQFGAVSLKNYSSFFDGFVLKLTSDGNISWLKQLGGERVDQCHGISIDHNDNAYVAGYYQLSATFGSITLTDTHYLDNTAFIAKYDPDGKALWAKRPQQSDDGQSEAKSITGWGSNAGNLIHVAGNFGTDISFGKTMLGGTNGGGFFLAAIDQNKTADVTKRVSENTLSVYPNPSHSSCNINFQLASSSVVEIQCMDMLGRLAYRWDKLLPSGQQSVLLDLKALPVGMYNCIVIAGNKQIGNTSLVVE
jgi:hypothetical protein